MNATKDAIETRMAAIAEAWTAETLTAEDVAQEYRRQYGDAPDLLELADHTLRLLYDPASLPTPDDPAEARALGEALLRQAELCRHMADKLEAAEHSGDEGNPKAA